MGRGKVEILYNLKVFTSKHPLYKAHGGKFTLQKRVTHTIDSPSRISINGANGPLNVTIKRRIKLALGWAKQSFGVTSDMGPFAKAIANDFPVAAITGRADVLDLFGHGVLHGGTFNAQPVAIAAALATMNALMPELFATIERRGRRLMDGIRSELTAAGHKVVVTGWGQFFHVAFDLGAPARNYRGLVRMIKAKYVKFTAALLGRGVRALERGAWFMSIEHDDTIEDQTLEAVKKAAREIGSA